MGDPCPDSLGMGGWRGCSGDGGSALPPHQSLAGHRSTDPTPHFGPRLSAFPSSSSSNPTPSNPFLHRMGTGDAGGGEVGHERGTGVLHGGPRCPYPWEMGRLKGMEGMEDHPWKVRAVEMGALLPPCPHPGAQSSTGAQTPLPASVPTSTQPFPPRPFPKIPCESPSPSRRGAGVAGLAPFRKRGPGARGRVRGAWDEFSLLAPFPGSHPWKCHWKL